MTVSNLEFGILLVVRLLAHHLFLARLDRRYQVHLGYYVVLEEIVSGGLFLSIVRCSSSELSLGVFFYYSFYYKIEIYYY
jgi:hypothetical protein